MAKKVGSTKALIVYGPYPPGSKSNSHPQHILVRICGSTIDERVYSDNDDLAPALAVFDAELRRRLAARRQARSRSARVGRSTRTTSRTAPGSV